MKKTNDTPMEDFQALYNRQVNRVYRLALVMLGSQSDAEDMVQMVFLKVWEKKISFRDTDHETAWMQILLERYAHSEIGGTFILI